MDERITHQCFINNGEKIYRNNIKTHIRDCLNIKHITYGFGISYKSGIYVSGAIYDYRLVTTNYLNIKPLFFLFVGLVEFPNSVFIEWD